MFHHSLKKATVLIMMLVAGLGMVHSAPQRAYAVNNPTVFTIFASFSGWNYNNPPANPTLTEFRGVTFTATVEFDDFPGPSHDFAVYTKGYPAGSVSTLNPCSLTNTNGCLKKSAIVYSSACCITATFTFQPTVPADDFTGPGGYEYYCQYHPGTMHGKITVLKSPDIDNNGVVNIVDIATMAFAFETSTGPPPSPNWNMNADLDNNGKVDIIDVATGAFYFDLTL